MKHVFPESIFCQPSIQNTFLSGWVRQMFKLCRADSVYWCDGSEKEKEELIRLAVENGEVERLNPDILPGCLYARSAENDVARSENLTFICTRRKEDAGPTNNWMDPAEAHRKLSQIFKGCMSGRAMYVVPFLMGIPGSSFNKIGVQITDSLSVVLNMRIMTLVGRAALKELGSSPHFTRCLHSRAELDEKRRFICHFPENNTIWSVNTNYGGNALMGKKCLALRIGSWLGNKEGWLAEHMLIMGVENPKGEICYLAAAFPSQSGKTNLSMLVPPEKMKDYKIWTVGDDIAWLRPGDDGRLWAINPEAGFFAVAPGTNSKTNPNLLMAAQKNSIYTNVVKTPDGDVWWEGHDKEAPRVGALDWRGKPWNPALGINGAHANSRVTVPAEQCPSISPYWRDPKGVPISAIIFGGRRSRLEPLVYQAFDWEHGVYTGATMASESTSAATGQAGVLRRDPMAMLPFCGYNMADYLAHWLSFKKRLKTPPLIFRVNWYRKDEAGQFIWPGFGENLRILDWITRRAARQVGAVRSPVGWLPRVKDLCLDGLPLAAKTIQEKLLDVDVKGWLDEARSQEELFQRLGRALPQELVAQREALIVRLLRMSSRNKQRREKMEPVELLLAHHPFLDGVDEWYIEGLARYAKEANFKKNQFIIREGEKADKFYLITKGEVAVGVRRGKKFRPIQTLIQNDIIGWSWLLPPHEWHFDAVAKTPVKTIVLDGKFLRAKCEEDTALGYELLKRLTSTMVDRLSAMRKQLLSQSAKKM